MIRIYDKQVEEAEALLKINKRAYVLPEALAMAKTIIRMAEDIEYLRHEINRTERITAAFRLWRLGTYSDADVLEYFRSEDAGKAVSLTDHAWNYERNKQIHAKWLDLLDPHGGSK